MEAHVSHTSPQENKQGQANGPETESSKAVAAWYSKRRVAVRRGATGSLGRGRTGGGRFVELEAREGEVATLLLEADKVRETGDILGWSVN